MLLDALRTLGHEAVDDGDIVVVELDHQQARARAAVIDARVPRIIVAPIEQHALLLAAGANPTLLVTRADAALIGPLIAALHTKPARSPTRVVIVTGTRGGIGRTLLAVNLSRRLARRCRVALLDATGGGAAGWWLNAEAASWTDLEGLAAELSADHMPVIARETAAGVFLVGGGDRAPSDALAVAAVRASRAVYELVIIDAPPTFASTTHAIEPLADRVLVLTDGLASSVALLGAVTDGSWIIASGSRSARFAGHDVTAALPRDDVAVMTALTRRSQVGGRLGRAYDEFSDLLLTDLAR